MRKVFADSVYWIALMNPKDQWRRRVLDISRTFGAVSIVTSDEILIETLNYFAESGEHFRKIVTREKILLNQDVKITDSTHENFFNGFAFYSDRLDKGYSLTDCISMNVCREQGISEILTHDHHFTQEGFQILL